MSRRIKGTAAAPGIAIARIVQFHGDLEFIPTRALPDDASLAAEIARLEGAIGRASRAILFLRHELSATLSDRDTRIYDAQLALLHDATFKQDLLRAVEESRVNVEVALQQVIARYEKVFESMEDPVLRERAADVRDVGRQVLAALMEKEASVYIGDGQDYIFAAAEFLPSDAGSLDRERLRGIVTAKGGKYSHGSILARSLGIPALVGVGDALVKVPTGTEVALDGEAGVLLASPDAEELEKYRRRLAERAEEERRVFEVRFLPSLTPDGTEVALMANVESVRDFDHVDMRLVAGIGLFRTEFAFMERHQFPAEDQQVKMYATAVERAEGKVVTFRTLDVGGDKPLRYFRTPEERNPVLGWRGLRISLDWPDIFYTQLRAILRASAAGHVRILLPMVTNIEEVERCREVLEQIIDDLRDTDIAFDPEIELGVMIEVPAIAHVLDKILPLVDFVSVGTNDLVQYLLAVDRDNPRVASMYDPYHPAVLRLLKQIADTAAAAGKPASICGEIGGDHYFTAFLLGLGYRELSMVPTFLPRVKLMVRNFPIAECEEMAAAALAMQSTVQIRELAAEQTRVRWSHFLEGS
jgi:phosphotransferase system enzyme I (PtsI)